MGKRDVGAGAVEEEARKWERVVESGVDFGGLLSWSSFSEEEVKRSAKGSCLCVSGVCVFCGGENSCGERDVV